MRHLLLVSFVLALAAGAAAQDDVNVPRTTIGDVPRTYSHYMNAQEAALCRANAAAGGLAAYFFNPAVIADLSGVAGQATLRFNLTSRPYLPDSGDEYLDATDDGLLFSQAVAAKRSDDFALGFAYSCPSYRSYGLDGRWKEAPYEGDFSGSVRFFEVLGAMRIGSSGQGGIGIAAGIANLDESARESYQRALSSAQMDGVAASVALGLTFDATERLTFGLGYRFGTDFKVEGEWRHEGQGAVAKGTARTEAVAVGGVRFDATEDLAFYASYIHEGWNGAESTFASYYGTEDECPDCSETENRRDEFADALSTAAVGAEGTVMQGRVTVRGGFSVPLGGRPNNDDEPQYRELAPEYSAGLGGTVRFEEYSVEVSLVREVFADGDESAQAVTHGIYVTVGYDF